MKEAPTDLLSYHRVILRSARLMGDATGDLVGVGWISVLARRTAAGVKQAQAAYVAALRAAR